jgi:hypothetical protein
MELLQRGYLLTLERISFDPHFISYFGEKKEVAKNWDAVRRYLHPGYRPLYGYDLSTGSCFYALWIKEYYKGYRRLGEMIQSIQKGLVNGNRIKEVYIDREFYCFSDLRQLVEDYGVDFTIAAQKSDKLEKWLDKIDGRRCGYYINSRKQKVKVGLLEIPGGKYNKKYPYKLTLIGFEEVRKKGIHRYGYLSSIPVDRYRPTELGKLAKFRWRHENYFKEVIHQQSCDDVPSNDEDQIKGHLALEMLGYNIVQLLKRDLPRGSKLKRAELNTFKIKLFQKVAMIRKGASRVLVEFTRYFLEQRNIPWITKKYDRRLLSLFGGKRLVFRVKNKFGR